MQQQSQNPPANERRQDFIDWKQHVDRRLDAQDKKLEEILAAFRASKLGASAIAWLAAVGAGLAVMYHNLTGKW